MEIIKKGKVPNIMYEGVCSVCGCMIRAERSDPPFTSTHKIYFNNTWDISEGKHGGHAIPWTGLPNPKEEEEEPVTADRLYECPTENCWGLIRTYLINGDVIK